VEGNPVSNASDAGEGGFRLDGGDRGVLKAEIARDA
jgi:hypothetical protein